eukprot:135312-Rhodomonas_salina.2
MQAASETLSARHLLLSLPASGGRTSGHRLSSQSATAFAESSSDQIACVCDERRPPSHASLFPERRQRAPHPQAGALRLTATSGCSCDSAT